MDTTTTKGDEMTYLDAITAHEARQAAEMTSPDDECRYEGGWCVAHSPEYHDRGEGYADGQPVRFTLDETPVFDGYAHGTTWNGFDDVYVTPEVRDEIVRFLRSTAPAGSDPDESVSGIDTIEPFDRDGRTYISLGGGFVARIVDDRDDEITYDEAEALGLDGTGRDLDPRFPYRESNLTADEYARLLDIRGSVYCDVHGGPTTLDYIVVAEGGSIPDQVICIECIDLLGEDQRVWATDNAKMNVGHNCLDYAEVRGSEGYWECALCGIILEKAGDALVVPMA